MCTWITFKLLYFSHAMSQQIPTSRHCLKQTSEGFATWRMLSCKAFSGSSTLRVVGTFRPIDVLNVSLRVNSCDRLGWSAWYLTYYNQESQRIVQSEGGIRQQYPLISATFFDFFWLCLNGKDATAGNRIRNLIGSAFSIIHLPIIYIH